MLAAIGVTAFSVHAQTPLVSSIGNPADTVTNAATKYLTLKTGWGTYYKTVEVATTLTKISGTVAATVTLEYSVDGTNFYGFKKDSTFTATDVSAQTLGWSLKDWGAKFLRVKIVGSGTQAVQVKALAYPRKENI
ncbi:hypothetical protein DCC81_24750 [Chitinophaga parva]|uniref:Uncharacterized protein n=1 Tax=Chitinophaga parva TaxID=2169414 RepID=A0A2T7BBN9_9BACT|nr:hypothetical protein DCC81_24750 [Chitinophaga parva]